jgi:hypothetical protein
LKIRWTAESVRFRITPSELDSLQRGELIGETLALPGGGMWSASILPGLSIPTRLDATGNELCLSLNDGDLDHLAEDDVEGVSFKQAGAEIRYLLEKDFPCIHPRPLHAAEPVTETFAPPAGFEARKA